MSRLDSYTDKVMDLVGQVGDNLRGALPDNAGKWLQTGAALGVAKAGGKTVTGFVRRNPAVAVAAVVGAGLVWYAARRHARRKQAQGAVIEGKSKRIDARRETGTPSPRRRAKAASDE